MGGWIAVPPHRLEGKLFARMLMGLRRRDAEADGGGDRREECASGAKSVLQCLAFSGTKSVLMGRARQWQ